MQPVPRYRFERLVADALDDLPDELAAVLDNVVVVVEDRHPHEPDLLGLYEGFALTERGWQYGGELPDRIMIYREAICEICETEDEVVDEVTITVVHEIAHHFGIEEERLHESPGGGLVGEAFTHGLDKVVAPAVEIAHEVSSFYVEGLPLV